MTTALQVTGTPSTRRVFAPKGALPVDLESSEGTLSFISQTGQFVTGDALQLNALTDSITSLGQAAALELAQALTFNANSDALTASSQSAELDLSALLAAAADSVLLQNQSGSFTSAQAITLIARNDIIALNPQFGTISTALALVAVDGAIINIGQQATLLTQRGKPPNIRIFKVKPVYITNTFKVKSATRG